MFLPLVFIIYWLIPSKFIRIQNIFIIISSYFFYACWNWRFLSLIILSTLVDYWVGISLSKTEKKRNRKYLLLISIFVNIGFLSFFKYFNFFIDSFVETFHFFGYSINADRLDIILPVGISFYTFQTLSYSIDVYHRKISPTRDIISFSSFVCFFPQLVAGPIERAKNLLPQFQKERVFVYDQAVDGLRQMLWGLFKKIVIADNCAIYVDNIFSNYSIYSGSTLLLGSLLFAVQIYGDFSGYSDIAIGTSRLLGINLMKNFDFPYFSRNIAEFWQRWHISLITWFRDYVYIPLGRTRGRLWLKMRNISILFLVSGLWHGAKWNFITWGMWNAMVYNFLMLLKMNRVNRDTVAAGRQIPDLNEIAQIGTTFAVTLIGMILFRSRSVADALSYLLRMFSPSLFSFPEIHLEVSTIFFIVLFFITEWIQREKPHGLHLDSDRIPQIFRWGLYYTIIWVIFSFSGHEQEFIYFRF